MKVVTDIWDRRSAVKQLVLKNFRVRYRNMALGVLWSVLSPLIMMGVLAFVFTYVYPPSTKIPYFPVFLLIGLVHYNCFSRNLPAATLSVVENASLIKKVAFPRLIIPLSVILAQLTDILVMLALLLVFALGFGLPLSWNLLWMLLAIVVQTLFTAGVGFLCSALNVYYRDMLYIVESGLSVLFWVTPIFYSLDTIRPRLSPLIYNLYILNPITGCIEASRRALLYQACPDLRSGVVALGVSIGTLLLGVIVFQRLQRRFADFT